MLSGIYLAYNHDGACRRSEMGQYTMLNKYGSTMQLVSAGKRRFSIIT